MEAPGPQNQQGQQRQFTRQPKRLREVVIGLPHALGPKMPGTARLPGHEYRRRPPPTHPDSRFYGTTELPNTVEKVSGAVQDKLKME